MPCPLIDVCPLYNEFFRNAEGVERLCRSEKGWRACIYYDQCKNDSDARKCIEKLRNEIRGRTKQRTILEYARKMKKEYNGETDKNKKNGLKKLVVETMCDHCEVTMIY